MLKSIGADSWSGYRWNSDRGILKKVSPLDSTLEWVPEDPPCPAGGWWGVWSSDITSCQPEGEKRTQRQESVNTSQMKYLMPSPHPVTETQASLFPNASLPYGCEVPPAKHSRAVVMWDKPQERAGRREQSWDTAAQILTVHRCFLQSFTHRPFTKMWLELETSSLYITDPDKKLSKNVSTFANCCQMLGLCIS